MLVQGGVVLNSEDRREYARIFKAIFFETVRQVLMACKVPAN